MSFINTNDPTTIGTIIMSVIIVVGALILTRSTRRITRNPLKGIFKKNIPQSKQLSKNASAKMTIGTPLLKGHGEQPRRQIATNPLEHANPDSAPYNQLHDGQWHRIADRIEDNIARVKSAAQDQTQAITQLDAAEFSLSELFREFPDARKQINPVTYLEFPALKAPRADEVDELTAQGAQAARA